MCVCSVCNCIKKSKLVLNQGEEVEDWANSDVGAEEEEVINFFELIGLERKMIFCINHKS